MRFLVPVRTRGMENFESDNLPPELDELGKRISKERPVASNFALDRVMTRAQGARSARRSSLLWRSSAPRAPKKSIAVGIAALLAMAGMAGAAGALTLIPINVGSLVTSDPDASLAQYTECPTAPLTVFVDGQVGEVDVLAELQFLFPTAESIDIIAEVQAGDQINVLACIVLPVPSL
ncbi:MAG: hypothetical protein ACR2LK_02550 [Solirubrobacteraceae bacterium]